MSSTPIPLPDALEQVRAQSLSTSPVRGLFWLAMIVPRELGDMKEIRADRIIEIARELSDADVSGLRNKPTSLRDIEEMVKGFPETIRVPGINVEGGGPCDIYLDTGVLQEKHCRNLGIGGGTLKNTATEVIAWTPVGLALNARHLDGEIDRPDPDWAYKRTKEFMSLLPMPWIYDELLHHGFSFKSTSTSPDRPIERQSIHDPVGAWLPAYQDANGRNHDAMDFLVERVAPWGLERLTKIAVFLGQTDGAAMAGFQAARLHDIATETYIGLRATQHFDGALLPIGENSNVHKAIGLMISEGANITAQQWGPQRRFGNDENSLEAGELVGCIFGPYTPGTDLSTPKWDDNWRLAALNRLHDLGHDTVVVHIDDPVTDRSYSKLPLYLALSRNEPGCIAQLIEWGASEKANIHSTENEEGGTISAIAEKIEAEFPDSQGVSVFRTALTRRSAMDVLRDIDLSAPPAP